MYPQTDLRPTKYCFNPQSNSKVIVLELMQNIRLGQYLENGWQELIYYIVYKSKRIHKTLVSHAQSAVLITGTWMTVNKTTAFCKLSTLLLEGVLEFIDTPGAVYEIEADFIIIKGGRLIIGWPEDHFDGLATITLRGGHSSPYHDPGDGPTLGSKAIGLLDILFARMTELIREYAWWIRCLQIKHD